MGLDNLIDIFTFMQLMPITTEVCEYDIHRCRCIGFVVFSFLHFMYTSGRLIRCFRVSVKSGCTDVSTFLITLF